MLPHIVSTPIKPNNSGYLPEGTVTVDISKLSQMELTDIIINPNNSSSAQQAAMDEFVRRNFMFIDNGVLKVAEGGKNLLRFVGILGKSSTKGTKIIKSADDVIFKQSSIDKAFGKHAADFGKYPDGSNASVKLFVNDVKKLINTGIQKSGTWYGRQGTHIYNPTTRQWAFINLDGTFNTALKLSPDQFKYLIETGAVR
jgi:hypothetical protein